MNDSERKSLAEKVRKLKKEWIGNWSKKNLENSLNKVKGFNQACEEIAVMIEEGK